MLTKPLTALAGLTLILGMPACGDAELATAPTTVVTVTAEAEPATTVTVTETLPAEAGMTEESIDEDDDIIWIEEGGDDLYQIRHFQEDISAHLGLDSNGYVKVPGSSTTCEASVIMPNKTTVEVYADAGDLVATNPNGTAGVKVGSTGGERECLKFFTEALADFGRDG